MDKESEQEQEIKVKVLTAKVSLDCFVGVV